MQEFIVIHPYTQEESIEINLRRLGCDRFNVLGIEEVDTVGSLTHNFKNLSTLRFSDVYPFISYEPRALFLQELPVVVGKGDITKRSDIAHEEVEVRVRSSLILGGGKGSYWEEAVTTYRYGPGLTWLTNIDERVGTVSLVHELSLLGDLVKGDRYVGKFNYASFLTLCRRMGEHLRYV